MKTLLKYVPALIIMSAVQVLIGCKVSKDIVAPDMELPRTYRDHASDTVSIAKIPWKSYFKDDELDGLISDALAYNNDLQIAIKNIEAAGLTLKQAKLGNVPNVGLDVTASSSRPSDNSLNGLSLNQYLSTKHIEDYTTAASLSWEADIWGKIRSQKAGALASFLVSEEARKVVQTRIVSDISKGYYNLLMLDNQLLIAKHNVLLNDSTLNIIKLQYNSGQVTSLAIQQALAQKLTAAGLVPQFEQQIAIQENAICVLSGRMPKGIARKKTLNSVTISDRLGSGLPSEILRDRPDVRQAELALSVANANVGFAKANLYPSLSITAQGGLDAFKASNWFNIPASLFGAVAGNITQPLFNQKKLSTSYQISQIDREQTVYRFRQSVLSAVGEVSDALVKLDKLQQQEDFATERTSTLQDATHNSQLLFKNGLANYLEVITAQSSVLQSELELSSIKKARLDATVDLYRSLGGGWQ